MTTRHLPLPWLNQPQGAVTASADGLVLAVIPAVTLRNIVSGAMPTVLGTAPTVTALNADEYGQTLEIHPSGGSSGYGTLVYGPETVGTSNDWTFVWVGDPLIFTDANGVLMLRGQDGAGNGWNLKLQYKNFGAELEATAIDTSPAAFAVTLSMTGLAPPPAVPVTHQRVALCKRGTTITVYDWRTGRQASASAGNGSLRTSTTGISFGAINGTDLAGNFRLNAGLAYNKALQDSEVWALLWNPWSALEAQRVAVPMAASGSPFDIASTAAIGITGAATLTGNIGWVQNVLASAAIAVSGSLGVSGDIAFEIKRWRVPTTAPGGTDVHVTILSGASPTYSIVTQAAAVADTDGFVEIPATGTIGTKRLAFVHNFDDDTDTVSIYGGPGIAELIDAG